MTKALILPCPDFCYSDFKLGDNLGLHVGGFETDFKIMLDKSPKHIAIIKLCPKKRKRGDYAVMHLQVNVMDVSMETDEQMQTDGEMLVANILELEVKPLLEKILDAIPDLSRSLKHSD